MEIFKLQTNFHPGPTFSLKPEDSFAWAERYQAAGDFQIVVEDDITALQKLPLDSLISHTDTHEVMIVENHEIKRDQDKKLHVTISGRSVETFAEDRITSGSKQPVLGSGDTAIVETYTGTAAATANYLMLYALQTDFADVADAIANLNIERDIRAPGPSATTIIKRGDVYSRMMEYLKSDDAGIKTVRPDLSLNTLDIIIHDGADRTGTVVFYAQYEDLDDAQYFWSDKAYRNYAFVATKYDGRFIRQLDLGADVTGWNRREMYVEAQDIDDPYPTYSPGTSTDKLASRGYIGLQQNPKVQLITATISKTAKPKFKINYDVGDLVMVFGEFASAQAMRVAEHILTIDKDNGMQGYPALTIV